MIRIDVDRCSVEIWPEGQVRVINSEGKSPQVVEMPGMVFSLLVEAFIGARDELRRKNK